MLVDKPIHLERGSRLSLAVLLGLALLLRVLAGVYLPNIHHGDEVFQTVEQAHRAIHGYGVIPVDFRLGSRPTILGDLLTPVVLVGDTLGGPGAGVALAVPIAMSAISLLIVIAGFLWGWREHGRYGGILVGALCAVWFELVYFGPKPNFESPAAAFLIVGIFLLDFNGASNFKRSFWAGVALGMAAALRVHISPAIAIAVIYACRSQWRARWLPTILGVVCILAGIGLLDVIHGNYPFQSYVRYIWVNVFLGGTVQMSGAQSIFFIPQQFVEKWGGAAVVLAAGIVAGTRRIPLLFITAITILFLHAIQPHKEYRFIYPAFVMLILLAGVGFLAIVKAWPTVWGTGIPTWAMLVAAILITSCILAGGEYYRSYWTAYRGTILAFRDIGHQEDACGVGINAKWDDTPGYSALARRVPIYAAGRSNPLADLSNSANYLIEVGSDTNPGTPFALWRRYGDVSLTKFTLKVTPVAVYRRSGPCTPDEASILWQPRPISFPAIQPFDKPVPGANPFITHEAGTR